ncbi:MAG TPA: hypothetical protein VGF80_03285 [Galbitalea sp.]|jgi:hypothetical protein
MRIGIAIATLVVGAILRFAITLPNPVIDLGVVGAILMGTGFVALAVAIFFALRPRSTTETTIGERRREELPPTKPYSRP